MPDWLAIVLGVIGGIGTIAGIFGLTAYLNERAKRKAQKKNEEEDKMEQLKINAYKQELRDIIKSELVPLTTKVDALTVQVTKIEGASLSTIRDAITSCYYKCSAKGYRNDYDYQNVHHMYENYVELHGNSYIEDIMKRFDALPVKEETIPVKVVKRKPKKELLVENKK